MKKTTLFLTIVLIWAMGVLPGKAFAQEKTQVLVIGTIHGGHDNNPNYSYRHIVDILGTYGPDAICVEIPPSYFRKQSYLKEMMVASIYGFENHKSVYPIDWWPSVDARAERMEYMKTEEYKVKVQIADSLENASIIMRSFTEKYGSMDNILTGNVMGYGFFNGREYNDYIRESYSISLGVFGDGCMNIYSEQRNGEMMALIDSAIVENRGGRVIVLTGAEHKYYFDDALSARADVALVDFEEILPLREAALQENMSDYFEYGLATGYYDVSEGWAAESLYRNALIPLIHGMNMDARPEIVPAENIEKARFVVAKWESNGPESVVLGFEKAWIAFLAKDYSQAIEISESIVNRLDEIEQDDPMRWFYTIFFWRNLGFSYDMAGEREKAVNAYRQCQTVCAEFGMGEERAKMIYQDFDNEPYVRGE